MNIVDLYADDCYNSMVDLTTTFPVTLFPVFEQGSKKVIAAFEYANIKGLKSRIEDKKSHQDPTEIRIMEYFARVFSNAYVKLF